MSARPTFGLLLDWLEDEYHNNVFRGVEDAARKLGVNVIVFAGGVLSDPDRGGLHRNFIYDLIGPENVSGLIVMSGAIGNKVGAEELGRFCERFRPLPMCSVGVPLARMPCIQVENERGMRMLLVHLIQVHGYRRIAFIRGPQANPEAEGRYRVYCEVLDEYGIARDPDLITEGDFQRSAGFAAVRTLLDERQVQFDALVAADDDMALGALDALAARGVRVPYDVAVAGFDDLQAARFATSPLTTVRQPLRQQGAYALQSVLAQSRGESVDERVVLRTQLTLRESCGCPAQTALAFAHQARQPSSDSLEHTLVERRPRIIQDMAQAMRTLAGSLEVGWGERLLDALGAELRRDPEGVFLSTLDELLTTVSVLGGRITAWQGAISALRHHAEACDQSDPLGCARAEDLWHQARVSIGNVAERAQAQKRLHAERWSHVLRTTDEALSTSVDSADLQDTLAAELPQLKLPACHVALFEGEQRPAARARIVAAYRSGSGPAPEEVGVIFPSCELLPAPRTATAHRFSRVVQPLFYESEPLGYVVLELGSHHGVMSEKLRGQLNAALKSSVLFQQVIDEASRRELLESQQTEREVGVAAQIRTAVLPRRFDVAGLRISAAMVPARESGGDYHDVLPAPDGCWLGIGDVAARGLPAGLVALMVQSAVAAACVHRPDASPSSLVRAVNSVLYENVQHRLAQDVSVGLTLIRCDTEGRMVFAGAHQDIIVCRSRDGHCTRLRTPGTPIGAVRDIERVTVDTHCQLDEADLVVLFTDGAVEATDGRGDRFGLDRLCAEVERCRTDSVEQIRDHLLQAIGAFVEVQHDDITIVVARFGSTEATVALDG